MGNLAFLVWSQYRTPCGHDGAARGAGDSGQPAVRSGARPALLILSSEAVRTSHILSGSVNGTTIYSVRGLNNRCTGTVDAGRATTACCTRGRPELQPRVYYMNGRLRGDGERRVPERAGNVGATQRDGEPGHGEVRCVMPAEARPERERPGAGPRAVLAGRGCEDGATQPNADASHPRKCISESLENIFMLTRFY